jgi:uncharacterized membrane protein
MFIALDALWLTTMGPRFYQTHLAHLLGPVHVPPAIVFYLVYCVGILVFAIAPGVQAKTWWIAGGLGALFGFVAYATYDLTNMATMKEWPAIVTVVDLVWGAVLTGTVASLAYLVAVRWIV